jgi:LAS superfamily LD-carboxypeptidase LdcB
MSVAAGTALPARADLTDEINELKEERAELEKSRQSQAKAIDATTAEANELAAALAALNGQVNEQEGRLAAAEAGLVEAEKRFADASQAVVDKINEIESLKRQVSNRAVAAFVDQNLANNPVLENTDPNEAVRMQSLVESVTRQEVDVAEQLRVAREDLTFEEARADLAATEAEELRGTIEAELIALQQVRDEQARLADEAEARLEAQLAEAQIMEERDKALAADITEKNKELQRQMELARRRNNPAPTNQANPSFPSADQITKVGVFWVHVDIAGNLQRMLDAAAADGIQLAGWGYRDHSAQIRLRRSHCGTSNYAVYHMPSSRCRPPTARPGASMHEQGKAIDFTYNGRTIGTRSSPAFQWLAANAGSYGFRNLPSEPWHWSTNGR